MKKDTANGEIFVGQECIGDVRMENNLVERNVKDVKGVYVRTSCQSVLI